MPLEAKSQPCTRGHGCPHQNGAFGDRGRDGQDSKLSARVGTALILKLQCLSLLSQPLLPGSEHQMQALLTRYGPGKIYQVTSNINGTGTLDLTLPRGQIVALLQNKDTKGNNSRWLVDTGGMWAPMTLSSPFGKASF